MPTYDYVCRFCQHSFELFQSISEPLKRKCPQCGRMGLDRLFGTGIGVVFKGSGFYETDYKRAGQSAAKDGSGESKKSGTSADPEGANNPSSSQGKPETQKKVKGKTSKPDKGS